MTAFIITILALFALGAITQAHKFMFKLQPNEQKTIRVEFVDFPCKLAILAWGIVVLCAGK